jgi:hypothetical protein
MKKLAFLLFSAALLDAAPVFIVRNAVRDVGEFKQLADAVAPLKRIGEVQVDIGVLADKAWHHIPPGGSPWHEFGLYNTALYNFYPDAKIAPHIPAEWVAKNRELLLAKAAILRQHGLSAALTSNDTHYMPESFFREYPQLRGPRVDHPRRTRAEAFSWCVDRPEVLAMIESMMTTMIRNVPEIKTIFAQNNDSGAGLCWASGQYAGPNGPAFCRNRTTGMRLRDLMQAMQRGANKAGGDITIRLAGTFDEAEEREFQPLLPKNAYLSRPYTRRTPPEGDQTIVWTGTMIHDSYPVLGLLDVVYLLEALEKTHNSNIKTVVLTVGQPWYFRQNDSIPVIRKLVEVVEAYYAAPYSGPAGRRALIEKLAARWAGEQNKVALADALIQMHEAFRIQHEAVPGYDFYHFEGYMPVSSRFLTRPLLIRPSLLSKEEEAYFLPHVFAVYESEAREDYQDSYETVLQGPPSWDFPAVRDFLRLAAQSADSLDALQAAPEQQWLRDSAISMRLWAAEYRGIHNFHFAQEIRNRHKAELSGPVRIPPMESDAGDPDNLRWHKIQRDEFDNTNEIIALLKAGGLKNFAYSKDKKHEDTFLLGPDFLSQMQTKADLMRQHWRDVDKYLTPGRGFAK